MKPSPQGEGGPRQRWMYHIAARSHTSLREVWQISSAMKCCRAAYKVGGAVITHFGEVKFRVAR